jgi:hypothetical protein
VGTRIQAALQSMRRHPVEFLQYFAGRLDHVILFSAAADEIPPPGLLEGATLRKLTDAELRQLPHPSAEWRELEAHRFAEFGFNGAYAIFYGDELAHVSWVVPPEQEAATGPRIVGLKSGEIEISACYTSPAFRGRSIYPHVIRCLAAIYREQGTKLIWMKTNADNIASQRGIEKAGLKRRGHALRWWFGYLPGFEGFILRGHRW